MLLHAELSSPTLAYPGAIPSLKEIVMGVHWTPGGAAEASDLDALCVLYDAGGRVLETVDGSHPRNANDSVVHTGDSRDGASIWDDERIFVFTDALPADVARVAFFVVCADGRSFDQVPGARCHISDHATEHLWLQTDLTALRGQRSREVAILQRSAGGWSLTE